MKNILILILLSIIFAFFLKGIGVAEEYLVSEYMLRDDLRISKICSDNKLFIIAESENRYTGIKSGGLGVGLGITQVMEEIDGKLVPVYCN